MSQHIIHLTTNIAYIAEESDAKIKKNFGMVAVHNFAR